MCAFSWIRVFENVLSKTLINHEWPFVKKKTYLKNQVLKDLIVKTYTDICVWFNYKGKVVNYAVLVSLELSHHCKNS